jgi:hypothetical protein
MVHIVFGIISMFMAEAKIIVAVRSNRYLFLRFFYGTQIDTPIF